MEIKTFLTRKMSLRKIYSQEDILCHDDKYKFLLISFLSGNMSIN